MKIFFTKIFLSTLHLIAIFISIKNGIRKLPKKNPPTYLQFSIDKTIFYRLPTNVQAYSLSHNWVQLDPTLHDNFDRLLDPDILEKVLLYFLHHNVIRHDNIEKWHGIVQNLYCLGPPEYRKNIENFYRQLYYAGFKLEVPFLFDGDLSLIVFNELEGELIYENSTSLFKKRPYQLRFLQEWLPSLPLELQNQIADFLTNRDYFRWQEWYYQNQISLRGLKQK